MLIMAFRNNSPRGDPNETVRNLLCIVDDLHKHMSSYILKEKNRPPPISPVPVHFDDISSHVHLVLRLSNPLRLLEHRLLKLQDHREELQDELFIYSNLLDSLLSKVVSSEISSQLTRGMKTDVDVITSKISELVAMVPTLPDKPARQKTIYSQDDLGDNNAVRIMHLPGLHENPEILNKLEVYRQVEQRFKELELDRKMCLLSFAVFPQNREVHRTMLKYWWIGEGILRVEGAEETVREILKEFTNKKLVEPVEERRKVAPSSYKMNPFVHSSVIHLSAEIGFFDIYRSHRAPSMRQSKMEKVCLVKGSSSVEHAYINEIISAENIETVFNVNERYPEFTLKWFSEHSSNRKLFKLSKTVFKSLHVSYLGRWQRTQKPYIQVRNAELMKCFKATKNLKFLSFQGISLIRKLNSSVCKLHNLIILDLRECSDLTELPEKIDSLHSLVYLDMTGCYLVEWIPMRLALLNNLEVLKGFVVSETMYESVACTLSLLKRLKKLRKLSIEIHRDDIGVHQLMEDLVKFKALTSLKVTWRRDLNIVRAGKPEDFAEIESLPNQFKKVDLQRYPHEKLPAWLQPQNLHHLRKLHIGGGRTLKGFDDLLEKATQCSVEILRLRSLPKLKVGWIELKQLYFPNLIFLESYQCPRVTLTPCDGNGIWRADQDE